MSKKLQKYKRLAEQIQRLTEKVENPLSRMATISAILHHKMKGFYWTGFYQLNNSELEVLGYQGPLACLRLKKNTGVCWAAINSGKTVIVGDVDEFPGHIACSSASKSEIVVPVYKEDKVLACLDIDSKELHQFDEEDRLGLEAIVALVYA